MTYFFSFILQPYYDFIFFLICLLSYVHDAVTDFLKTITAEDKKLPSVQPIRVTMPENYPENSPTCTTLLDQSGKYSACDSYRMSTTTTSI